MKKIYKTLPAVITIPAILLNFAVKQTYAEGNYGEKEVAQSVLTNNLTDNDIVINDTTVKDVYKQCLVNQNTEGVNQKELEKEKERLERIRLINVNYNSEDINQISGITEEELHDLLLAKNESSMAKLAGAFVDAENEYGINAFFLAGLAALEGGWAKSDRAIYDNNLTGMAVFSDSSTGTIYDSKYECILDTARQLRKFYLTPGAEHYNGTSSSDIEMSYCAKKDWNEQIDKIAYGLVNDFHENLNK